MTTVSLQSSPQPPVNRLQQPRDAAVKGEERVQVQRRVAVAQESGTESRLVASSQQRATGSTPTPIPTTQSGSTESLKEGQPDNKRGRVEEERKEREEKLEAARKEREEMLKAKREAREARIEQERAAEQVKKIEAMEKKLFSNLHNLLEDDRDAEDLTALRYALDARIDLFA
ncbi:MAG: hypothetical protein HN842_12290 [Gammaproteobacteria bacterium]|jgi:hypothetical protein|nr:hypothetical protein [Gammaproteobacteria bacterium]